MTRCLEECGKKWRGRKADKTRVEEAGKTRRKKRKEGNQQ